MLSVLGDILYQLFLFSDVACLPLLLNESISYVALLNPGIELTTTRQKHKPALTKKTLIDSNEIILFLDCMCSLYTNE